jgi:deoxyribonuclease-4
VGRPSARGRTDAAVAPDGPPIGVHLQLGRGLLRAAERAREIQATTVQVFVDNPTAWRRRSAPPRNLEAFRDRLAAQGVAPIAVHASYILNLGGPDPAFRSSSIDVLASDLRAAVGYGARLVNVHAGSHRDTSVETGIERLAGGVADVLAQVDDAPGSAVLVLENAAGGGWSIGATIGELVRVADRAAALGVPERRLAFCLDTAHAWGAGYALDDPDRGDELVREIDRELGLGRLAMVHLNDSRSELGSRHDRHEHVGAGKIGARGLGHLVRHPDLAEVPFILETPGMDEGYDRVNLDRVRALLAGEELPPLPAEAFRLSRRSRSAAPADDDVAS